MAVDVRLSAGGWDGAPTALLERGVRRVLDVEGIREGALSVTLVDDHRIRELNREYLDRDRVTDVLAFALHDAGEALLGDVYLGREQARRQAREHGVELDEELLRLAVHGTLHVLGYDHPEGPERLDSPMFRRQEELVRSVVGPDAAG